ncbi:MAG: hypothetical protein KDC38_02375 [Planctomycetes bacterium]|nr:hypothetical protein [Planctomycetota bacterium]
MLRRRPPRSVWIAAVIVVAVAILAATVVFLDIPAPDDRHLRLVPVSVPSRTNGYAAFDTLLQRVWPIGVRRAQVEASLLGDRGSALREQFLAEWDDVTAFEHFVPPVREKSADPIFVHGEGITQLVTARATTRRARGDHHAALADYLALVRIGHEIASQNSDSFRASGANRIKATGLLGIRELAMEDRLDAKTIVDARTRLAERRWELGDVESVVRCEYHLDSRLILDASSDRSSGLLKPNLTRQGFVQYCDTILGEARGPQSDTAEQWARTFAEHLGSWRAVFRANSTGDQLLLHGMSIVDTQRWIMLEDRATDIALALSLFRQDRGRNATSLAELVPEFLESLPEDPFDLAPLEFDPESGVVHRPEATIPVAPSQQDQRPR